MNEALQTMTKGQHHSFCTLAMLICFIVFTANGCMVGPDYHPPQPMVPTGWVGTEKAPAEQPSVAIAQPADFAAWWKQFNDPILDRLVDEAVRKNPNLLIAEARLRQARAARGVAVGGLWPSVTASGSYQRLHNSSTSVTPGNTDLYQAGLDAMWELDLFGGQRRNVESANANIQAAIENIRDVQVSLIAEVALDYIQLRGFQQQIIIARNNLDAQKHTADITRKRFTVGFASALDVANAEASVATTASQIPVFETSERQSIYALSVLLARLPADLMIQLSPVGKLPTIPVNIPVGLPSDLLRRRPDVRESEAQLHVATAQIGIAVADLFPSFSLTGTLNWSSNQLRTWWNEASRSSAIGPSITWPIFQGGAIISNVHVQEALRDQVFITYQETVLAAFQDVENAMVAFNKEQQHRKLLQDAVDNNRKAVNLSLLLYTEGQIEFLNVLVAQTSLYTSENALMQSDQNIVTDLIALYKALGGGWEAGPHDE
jgi:NodT family efflux transporter outer membrane factor (OMF) lipoprotein